LFVQRLFYTSHSEVTGILVSRGNVNDKYAKGSLKVETSSKGYVNVAYFTVTCENDYFKQCLMSTPIGSLVKVFTEMRPKSWVDRKSGQNRYLFNNVVFYWKVDPSEMIDETPGGEEEVDTPPSDEDSDITF